MKSWLYTHTYTHCSPCTAPLETPEGAMISVEEGEKKNWWMVGWKSPSKRKWSKSEREDTLCGPHVTGSRTHVWAVRRACCSNHYLRRLVRAPLGEEGSVMMILGTRCQPPLPHAFWWAEPSGPCCTQAMCRPRVSLTPAINIAFAWTSVLPLLFIISFLSYFLNRSLCW